jgi:hypothetical protein
MRARMFHRFASLLRRRRGEHETDYGAITGPEASLEAEYLKVIEQELRGWGVPASCATVQVQQLGQTPQGRGIFVGVVRLHAWERRPALRLLLGLPLLERRVKRALAPRWLLDVSHFGGLWLHASDRLNEAAGAELRELILQATGPRSGESQARPSQ